MTSRISFSKLVKDEYKKLNWLMALQLLGFGMLIPFRILIVMSSSVNDIEKWNAKIDLAEVFYGNIGLGLSENAFFIMAAGIICALCTFSYVHAPEKLDFLHSLPIKRERLFAVKVLGSTLTFVTAYLICQAAGLLLGAVYGVLAMNVVIETAVASIRGILQFLCSYSATLVAVMLTGKILTSVFAAISLLIYGPMLLYMQYGLQTLFLNTMFDVSDGYTRWLRFTSPWAFCMEQAMDSDSYMIRDGVRAGLTGAWPTAGDLCQLLALAAVVFLIAMQLYRIRRSEAAGKALAFGWMEGIVKILITVPVAVLAAMVGHEMFESIVWEMGFLVLFGILVCMLMELIYRWDFRLVLKRKHHMLITIVAAAVVFLAARYDITGYNTYLPKKDEIRSMSIKDNDYSFYYDLDSYRENVWQTQIDRELMDYLETENIDPIYEVARQGVAEAAGEYDAGDYYYRCYIKYHLKNGEEIYRSYKITWDVYNACLEELIEEDEFRKRYFPILGWDGKYEYYSTTFSVPQEYLTQYTEGDAGEKKTWEMTEEEKTQYYQQLADTEVLRVDMEIPSDRVGEVIEAYCRDLEKSTYTECMEGQGNLYFSHKYRNSEIYPFDHNFEETCKVLAEIWAEQ